jgi:mono/diheme cytochrome c family protein
LHDETLKKINTDRNRKENWRDMRNKVKVMAMGLSMAFAWAGVGFAADVSAGKALFEKSCAGCHGKDGKGNPGMAKVLGEKGLNITTKEVAQTPDEKLLKAIGGGLGKMPASKLSKEEQKEALGYVRTLAK